MSFREDFLKTPPGPARESLVFNAAIRQGPPKQLVPITITAPDGSKITYKTMPDYLMIDGIRVPMAGATAQRLANHWKMTLPTTKQSKQIWDAADTKIRPTPLSAGGRIGGVYYSGKDVVKRKISDSDSSIAYNQMIDAQLSGKTPTLVAGHMKDIVQPSDSNKLGLYGWYGKDGKPIQSSHHTPHDTTVHTEYGAGTRFISGLITITRPNGKVETVTAEQLQKDPTLFSSISSEPLRAYHVDKSKQTTPAAPKTNVQQTATQSRPEKSGRLSLLERIDQFLSTLKNI